MKLSDKIIIYLQGEFARMGRDTAVIGISGGKDSAVVAALLAQAIGPANVHGVMMPNGEQKDISDSEQVIRELGINGLIANISDQYEATIRTTQIASLCDGLASTKTGLAVSAEAKINVAPRLRMTKLYEVAQSLGAYGLHACVAGTGNKAEAYVGYCTKWGDMACDINPIKDLWVHEVLQVGDELGFFPSIIHKTPDDGLCGLTDEERLGFSYDDVYKAVTGAGEVEIGKLHRIARMHQVAQHKLNPIPYFKNSET
jgi:NAD+ synthetase